MKSIVLSIIIPMYNSEEYIAKCLESLIIRGLEVRDYEIIVINDGSSDHGPQIVKNYEKEYPELIRMINKENGGHGSAINIGTANAKGKYIKVIDADDWIENSTLKYLLSKLYDINADVILLSFYTFDIKKNKKILHEIRPQLCNRLYLFEHILSYWSELSEIFSIHGILYRRDFYQRLNLHIPEKVFYDDAYYTTMYCCYAKTMYLLHDPFYVYRIGNESQSISNENRIKKITELQIVITTIVKDYINSTDRELINEYYWEQRFLSTMSDFYITTLLKMSDRKSGKRLAMSFTDQIVQLLPEYKERLKKRYQLIYLFHKIPFGERYFYRCLKSKLYKTTKKVLNYHH